MELSEVLQLLLWQFVGRILPLAFWITVLILSALMLKRRGGKAERFLIAGSGIQIAAVILSIPTVLTTQLLFTNDVEIDSVRTISTLVNVFIDVIRAAGMICIIYAFWVKFNTAGTAQEV